MTSILLMFVLLADEKPVVRIMSGAVVELKGDTLTIANSKDRRVFTFTSETPVNVDGRQAGIEHVSVKDDATITYDVETGLPTKIQVVSERAKNAKLRERKKAETEKKKVKQAEAARDEERQKKRQEERDSKLIDELKREEEQKLKLRAESATVKKLGRGSYKFGPFDTKFGKMEVKVGKGRHGKQEVPELTIILVNPPVKGDRPPSSVSGKLVVSAAYDAEAFARLSQPADRRKEVDGSKDIKRITEILEKKITGEPIEPEVPRIYTIEFRLPRGAEIRLDDRIKLRIGDWTYRFNSEENPKILAALVEMFTKLNSD